MEESEVLKNRKENPSCAPKRKNGFRRNAYLFVKRAFDIVSSGLGLIVSSVVVLPCLLIKWLEDVGKPACRLEIRELTEEEAQTVSPKNRYVAKDGKVLECRIICEKGKKAKDKAPVYVSKRVGANGEFNFHKIRSMFPGAEDMKQQLVDAGLNEADPPAFKIKNDPRITKFGKILRKLSIDELPQLWDIFVGRMSVVGPRPPLPEEVLGYTEEQKRRLEVKGGLLCLWQIQKNRNSLSFDEWVKLDLEYIEKQSFLLDLKIIFKGAWMVLFDHSGE